MGFVPDTCDRPDPQELVCISSLLERRRARRNGIVQGGVPAETQSDFHCSHRSTPFKCHTEWPGIVAADRKRMNHQVSQESGTRPADQGFGQNEMCPTVSGGIMANNVVKSDEPRYLVTPPRVARPHATTRRSAVSSSRASHRRTACARHARRACRSRPR